MIKPALLSPNILKIVAPPRLSTDDFEELGMLLEPIVREFGSIRLLIDATALVGWESIAAIETHAGFVKTHQQMVERVAVIAPHEWQHWLVAAVRIFLHPQVRAFDPNQAGEALRWIHETGDPAHAGDGEHVERLVEEIVELR